MASDTPARRFPRGVIFGLFIITLGVIFLLDQLGVASAGHILRFFWPAILIFFGLEGVLANEGPGRFFGLLLTAAGALLLLDSLGYVHVSWAIFWPLAMIFWGFWMITQAFGRTPRWRLKKLDQLADRVRTRLGGDSSDAEWEYVALFSGVKKYITVKNFRGGRVTAFCGGFNIDLTHADIEGDEAYIDATAILGGGEIRVPETWDVSVRGTAFCGGYVDERHFTPSSSATKKLVVKGAALCGGVVIKN